MIKAIGKFYKGDVDVMKIANNILLLIAMLVVTSCLKLDSRDCILANEWGDREVSLSTVIDPTFKFQKPPTPIKITAGNKLAIEVGGLVDFCPKAYSVATQATQTGTGDGAKNGWNLLAAEGKYTVGEDIAIFAEGSYTDISGNAKTQGQGLYLYFDYQGGTPLPSIESNPDKYHSADNWWYGSYKGGESERKFKPGTPIGKDADGNIIPEKLSTDQFIELYDNGTVGKGGGFTGRIPGKKHGDPVSIYYRYARNADARQMDWEGSERSNPWMGKYIWNQGSCIACAYGVFESTCMFMGVFAPICIAAAKASCAADGMLPEQNKCREVPSSFDVDRAHENDPRTNVLDTENITQSGDNKIRAARFDHWIQNNNNGGCYPDYEKGGEALSYAFDYYKKGESAGGSCTGKLDKRDDNRRFSTKYAPNSGGYTLKISSGCLGKNGEYLSMLFVNSNAEDEYTTELKTEGDCKLSVDAGCRIKLDKEGRPEIRKTLKPPPGGASLISLTPSADGSGVIDLNGNSKEGYTAPASGTVWFQLDDTFAPVDYRDNIGSYGVNIKTVNTTGGFSDTINAVIKPMRHIIFGKCTGKDDSGKTRENLGETSCPAGSWKPGVTKRLYNQLISKDGTTETAFVAAVRAALVLYVIIYSMMYMVGMIKDPQKEFLVSIIRLSLVSLVISPEGWDFFNTYLFVIFTDGLNDLIGIMAGQFTGVVTVASDSYYAASSDQISAVTALNNTDPFQFMNQTISKFITETTMLKISALLFASPVGFIYIFVILWGMLFYLLAIIKAVILYILALFGISLLLALAPVFISMMLFKQTRGSFENWVKFLFNFLAQPVLLFTALAVFNAFIYSSITSLLNYDICWRCAFDIKIPMGVLKPIEFCLFHTYLPWDKYPSTEMGRMPINFFTILTFIILCQAMLRLTSWITELASELTVQSSSGSMNAAAGSVVSQAAKYSKMAGGQAFKLAKKAKDLMSNKKEDKKEDS
ncbi:type IV secretion system protein [Rickettsiales bacterium]|nr:type IV secretion system protein [Rickettsiales bacterium]